MTNEVAIKILQKLYEGCNKHKNTDLIKEAYNMAIEALKAQDAKGAIIYKQDAIDVLDEFQESAENGTPCYAKARVEMCNIPSALPDVAEKLYQYKCYITDQEGLQHEVIHIGDIRRVTGWEL